MEQELRDLKCKGLDESIDPRVVDYFERRFGLDPHYLRYMSAYHGGEPGVGTFDTASGRYRIELFLSLLDKKSELLGAARPHFNHSMDERVVDSVDFLATYEHATSRALFGRLLPFAAFRKEMRLDQAYVDLLCFDYREPRDRPPVVRWIADDASSAYFSWDQLPSSEAFNEEGEYASVPWDSFVEEVAEDFSAFVEMLMPNDG